ncbi:PREDICTED: splicing factor, arginine/serine-rich 19-like [Colobus angolensis palliatus]|uniref:splicing factor, arginine/serine-rich 19-like n=1 Tax=Colobus angolensis palliatus TaxID=336983 RepID=UPI0005F4D33E|nr:PREDICTED: splicing factor, arginine/serine-rich 19-like [Colobus angolensis palliatus]
MPRPLRVPLGAGGVRERRRALSGPLQPQPSSGNVYPLRKGRKNRSARRGEEPQAEARPRKGQRPAPRIRPRPFDSRRARGALGAAATHAPPATKRRGARARRPRGRGVGGGGPCGGLSRERAARRLGAEDPPGAEGHRGTVRHLPSRTVWEREASAASGGESRRWRDLPEAESPLLRPGCRGRRARERGLVCLAEGHGVPAEGSVLCFWSRAAVGAGAGHQTLWDFLALAEVHLMAFFFAGGGICAWLQVFPGAVPAQWFLVAPGVGKVDVVELEEKAAEGSRGQRSASQAPACSLMVLPLSPIS